MLQALGITQSDEETYLALLHNPHCTVSALADELGRSQAATRSALARLEELGFVARSVATPATLVATPPDAAVNALVVRRQQELEEAQAAGARLAESFPRELQARPAELVDIVVGVEAVQARFVQVSHAVRENLRVLDRPPYAQAVGPANASETDVLERGVQVRAIYCPESFELPGAFDRAMAAVAGGEQARVSTEVPMKLAVADDSMALMPLTNDGVVDSALVVRSPSVVAALVQLFELLWRQAGPLPAWDGDPSTAAPEEHIDTGLVALLATGLKDEAIARDLDVSVRTLRRRTSALLDVLGARNRFQAGVQAARRGLI
ncbi:MAG TPA: helix-turn-helix domain-containing protein [Segeticoccus sp.]|uniref:helix-turn-helix domain-containing protein n=1 Tax=Segeticoccus sp. TaxID=2706531 RepID=UPI002D7F4B25|nr:helix-turn-helix domain-containing protein [Segeticoccus sp.]HET8602167.1 helix-turn-helix domain-containing protein [Segeticoccus sp.]